MTMTYAEAIEQARAQREAVSMQINDLVERRKALTARILELEEAVRPPKRGKALPGDVVMAAEPAVVKMTPVKKR